VSDLLERFHRDELLIASAIEPDVVAERGYRTVMRPSANDARPRQELERLGFPKWATAEDRYFPGLLIPKYRATGERISYLWKPRVPAANRDGKLMKYAATKGHASRLDVHPRNRNTVADPTVPLWITEGVKKADSLTSRGCCVVALDGVYNWRSTMGTLGDWEDVPLRGRQVIVCFDADAETNGNVLRAMHRLGRWLKSKGAIPRYLITPGMVAGTAVKGVDDYFAAGGLLQDLVACATAAPPDAERHGQDTFTDSRMAELVADEVLADQYVWVEQFGWMAYNGRVWAECSDATIGESVRQFFVDRFAEVVKQFAASKGGDTTVLDLWRGMLSVGRQAAVLRLCRGLVERKHTDFDTDRDVFNTLSGVVELDSCGYRPASASDHMTKVAGAAFDLEARSPQWEEFIGRILPDEDVRLFVQRLFGYAMLGVVREHVMPIFTGEGANGKGTLRDAIVSAFGNYAAEVDPELLMVAHNPRHLTFMMELRGRRLVFLSETDRSRRFAEATMKRLVGGDPIQANRMHKDPITFDPSHTLVMCTNHLPLVAGDDPAVWRRILVVPFDVVIPEEERDGGLPEKLREQPVRAAILAWCLQGYQEYRRSGLNPPEAVRVRTANYKQDSDIVGRFIAERVEYGRSCSELVSSLYAAYVSWCKAEGEEAATKREFVRDMARRGHATRKVGGQVLYSGLMVTKTESADDESRWS
jgi:P4 family phage/plasmid primase-like protien